MDIVPWWVWSVVEKNICTVIRYVKIRKSGIKVTVIAEKHPKQREKSSQKSRDPESLHPPPPALVLDDARETLLSSFTFRQTMNGRENSTSLGIITDTRKKKGFSTKKGPSQLRHWIFFFSYGKAVWKKMVNKKRTTHTRFFWSLGLSDSV